MPFVFHYYTLFSLLLFHFFFVCANVIFFCAKLQMYKTLIRPVALYGSESWNMTSADENAFGVFERRVLRVIYGPKKEGDLFKSRSNAELYQLYKEADITRIIKVNRLRWAGHVVRRPIEAPINKVFKSDFTDGKRSRGRPKNSWREAVDRDSIALGIGNWQMEASDRASFRRKLREAMDHI